ncbi:MAG: GNAT family N-acetyltransferase [Oscillospiraceae bacterium]|jgi:hypothetical protein|nr:GNAT family N-acetyltransferase [Oscillospiraceae bacterium]
MRNTAVYIGSLTADTAYETEHFLLRLVRESDADDLLVCYSDPAAQKFFNYDPSTNRNYFHDCTRESILEMICWWRKEFERKSWVRFSIIDKLMQKAIGAVEIYDKFVRENRKYAGWAVVRIDILSSYEKADRIGELLELFNGFYKLFDVDFFVTKAIPEATERINALQIAGYTPFAWNTPNRSHYWGKCAQHE